MISSEVYLIFSLERIVTVVLFIVLLFVETRGLLVESDAVTSPPLAQRGNFSPHKNNSMR
jgi:hypothetical protein